MKSKKLAYIAVAIVLVVAAVLLLNGVRNSANERKRAEAELNQKVEKINENSNRELQRSKDDFEKERREANQQK
jgi:hypothetical protein